MTDDTSTIAAKTDPLDEQLVAYLDNELTPEERRTVDALLTSNDSVRERLRGMMRTWEMLNELGPAAVDDSFLRSTLEMVVVEARDEAEKTRAMAPVLRRRRWFWGVAGLAAVAAAGYWCVAVFWPDPNRELLDDLPVLERLDEYRNAGDIEFLRLLAREGIFDSGRPVLVDIKPEAGRPTAGEKSP